MSAWQSGDVESNGIRMHYTRTGGARPPLVLAHGVTDDGLCWIPVAEVLASEYDVIMVDARGHGRSEATEGGYDAATQAADLQGVIAVLGLHKPFVLGHSMGAVTALALAGLYPDTPRAIVLEDPPPFWMGKGRPSSARPRGADRGAHMRELKSKTRAELVARAREQNPSWSEAELGPWADSKLRMSLHVAAVYTSLGGAPDWQAVAPCITCPAMAIMADPERGAALTPQAAADLQAMVPHLQTVHIAGAGHNVRREQFARYIEVVRGFLDVMATTP